MTAAADEGKAAGQQAPPAGRSILHQRRNLPFSLKTMALGGFLITAAVGYYVLYLKKKPEASASDVAKVATNTARPEDTHPRH